MAPVKITGAIVATISVSMAVLSYMIITYPSNKNAHLPLFKKKKNNKKKLRNGLIDAVGNTPLIRINSLSEATGCEVSIFASFYDLGIF